MDNDSGIMALLLPYIDRKGYTLGTNMTPGYPLASTRKWWTEQLDITFKDVGIIDFGDGYVYTEGGSKEMAGTIEGI